MQDITKLLPNEKEEVKQVGILSKDYNIKKLWANQKEILRLLASGIYSPQEVADICKVHVSTVYRLAKSEYGRQHMAMIEGAADADTSNLVSRIKSLAPIALSIQADMMLDLDVDPKLRDKIADKIIDRAGYAPTTKIDMTSRKGLSHDDINSIVEKAEELRRMKRQLIEEEATFEEVEETK